MNLYNLILKELKEANVAFVDQFPPYYIMSAGCHMFNLVNDKRQILWEARRVEDTRLHIFFCAPAGFSKSFFLEQFLDEKFGLISQAIPSTFESKMTESGLIGTIRFQNGESIKVMGLASEYDTGIVGIEEFSAVVKMMQTEHSAELGEALLTALDRGRVQKHLAAGKLEYKTHFTLWTSSQPQRFNLASGLGRRFLFLQFIPGREERRILKKKRREAKNIPYNPVQLKQIRDRLKNIRKRLRKIESVTFDKEFYICLDELHVVHYEEPLYEKMALGFNIMTENFEDNNINVTVNDTLKRLMRREAYWRKRIGRGIQFEMVKTILKEYGGTMKEKKLKDALIAFGLNWIESANLLESMRKARIIKRYQGEVIKI